MLSATALEAHTCLSLPQGDTRCLGDMLVNLILPTCCLRILPLALTDGMLVFVLLRCFPVSLLIPRQECLPQHNRCCCYRHKFSTRGNGQKICLCNCSQNRALFRIKLLPVTHVLVGTWMLTVKPVYKLPNVHDDLKWTTNTHITPFTLTFKA